MKNIHIVALTVLCFTSSVAPSVAIEHKIGERNESIGSIFQSSTSMQMEPSANLKPASQDTGRCTLILDNRSVSKFRHEVYYKDASFAYLRLLPGKGIKIVGDRLIVGEHIWVWTFYGKEGGLEILKWPIEYGIWSMGLLTSFVLPKPLPMKLKKVSGNCSELKVGNATDDRIISEALKTLALEMNNVTKSEKYSASFFCHTNRKYISPNFLYMLCKHIVCPLEALKYECCSNFYNTKHQSRNITCELFRTFEYDPISWVLPTLISLILFGFSPMLLLYIAHVLCDGHRRRSSGHLYNAVRNTSSDIETSDIGDFVFLSERSNVTLFKTILSPLNLCFSSLNKRTSTFCRSVLKRLLRGFLAFFSLIFICIQFTLDYSYLHTLVLESVDKGVPMGFGSLMAGYEKSRHNFLPYLGGPYVAVSTYLFIACILLIIPDTISSTLLSGIPKGTVDESVTPLAMSLQSIFMYGSVKIAHRRDYAKLLSVLQAQFFMLINLRYWKHILGLQYDRWVGLLTRHSWCSVLTPFYVPLCLIEIILCLAFNGYPILSFGVIIIKAYCGRLMRMGTGRGCFFKGLFSLLTVVVVVSVLYFLFMFCTIFMDACLFVTRVVTFTFTGIVVYPKVAYGYIIFYCTILYYIAQCVHDFSGAYQTLLRETIAVCEKLQRANDSPQLVAKYGCLKGVHSDLFERVIENHLPRRKQVFLSLLKVGVILTILGLSLNVLVETDGFRELHVVMHVGTALFICALPQIMKTMCRRPGEKYRLKQLRREIADTVKMYQGRLENNDKSDESE